MPVPSGAMGSCRTVWAVSSSDTNYSSRLCHGLGLLEQGEQGLSSQNRLASPRPVPGPSSAMGPCRTVVGEIWYSMPVALSCRMGARDKRAALVVPEQIGLLQPCPWTQRRDGALRDSVG